MYSVTSGTFCQGSIGFHLIMDFSLNMFCLSDKKAKADKDEKEAEAEKKKAKKKKYNATYMSK